MTNDSGYVTVDIERRGYGRRYTWLPVDARSRDAFMIDCNGAYVRPEMYDIQTGDIVRWREGERIIEGTVGTVYYDNQQVHVGIEGAHPLPNEP